MAGGACATGTPSLGWRPRRKRLPGSAPSTCIRWATGPTIRGSSSSSPRTRIRRMPGPTITLGSSRTPVPLRAVGPHPETGHGLDLRTAHRVRRVAWAVRPSPALPAPHSASPTSVHCALLSVCEPLAPPCPNPRFRRTFGPFMLRKNVCAQGRSNVLPRTNGSPAMFALWRTPWT